MSKALLEITEDHLETGMRGFPVGYCTTSHVGPETGLHYVGRPMSEIASWSPEEAVYLLYHGKKGSEQEVTSFWQELRPRSVLKEETVAHIQALPRDGHPMALFSSAILITGMLEGQGDYKADCLDVIAKLPQIAAAVINHHAGWGGINPSNPELGYMENFAQMLNVPGGDVEQLTEIFRLFDILHFDHGGGNLSTFVGKAVASGLEDMYGSLAAAMNALAGPRHGRANQDCLNFVKEAHQELGDTATAEQVEAMIRKRLENKQLVFGFGHAVLRVEDPRATLFYEVAQKRFPDHPLVKTALLLRTEGTKVLKENPKVANPYPNVDAMSGTVLTASGFPHSEYYTVLFGMSRCVGISRQIVYERCEARDGKGTPIVRPKYLFKETHAST